MSGEAAEADALTIIRREIERNALRARNGLKYLTGGAREWPHAQRQGDDAIGFWSQ